MGAELLAGLAADDRARLRETNPPTWVDPMLATLTDKRFSDEGWLYERKFDGVRCLAFRHHDRVRLLSRKKQPLENTYPEIADQMAAQALDDFIVDGEIVAFERGHTSFSRLQQRSGITDPVRARRSPVAVTYYVFDLLYVAGYDTRALPLRARKRLLRAALAFHPPVRFTVHRNGNGEAYFASACAHGWEGVVAKKADAAYASRRSTNWLKFKCEGGQEMVVGGFTEPAGSRTGFGALLLGYYDRGGFVYAGKVGTGFDDATLRALRREMDGLEVDASPFRDARRFERGTHFVEPRLVAEIGFTEWTRDGMLRHPRFLGLRKDKSARDVVREKPVRTVDG